MSRVTCGARAVSLGLVALAALGGCNGGESPEPPPTPTPSPTQTTPAPEPSGTSDGDDALPEVTQDPDNARPLPQAPPEEFGAWSAVPGTSLQMGAMYTNAGGDRVIANFVERQTARDGLEMIREPEFVDNWYCGSSTSVEGDRECYTDAFDAQVYLMSSDLDHQEMVAFGQELLSNWT